MSTPETEPLAGRGNGEGPDQGSRADAVTPPTAAAAADALDRTFDELIESLVGFYRSWFLSLGVELGLVSAVAE